MRIGQGVDVHAFSADAGRPLRLGGTPIPGGPGLEGHSDADVVLHALVDALLGAAGLGDLGAVFGTADPAHAGVASSVFVAGALDRVTEAGWALVNADVTVVAQRPRLAAHRAAITDSVADLLGVPAGAVNVKATTTDGLGFTGRGEGIACLAVVLLAAR
ncbi:MAG: 2-C-methyl-D-erythritol 2,4-cyclodiphosphate synthase [Egibacteraceae bacterium]